MLALIILDGWGISQHTEGNALAIAHTPTTTYLSRHYPTGILSASGPAVGLAKGQAGNSEIGHLQLGTGRIVPNPDGLGPHIKNKSFFKSRVLRSCFQHVKTHGSRLHLVGIMDAEDEPVPVLKTLLDWACKEGIQNVFVHTVLDGQDSGPTEGLQQICALNRYLQKIKRGYIASCMGSSYLLDRTGRRIEKVWRMLIKEGKAAVQNVEQFVKDCYAQGIHDDEVMPTRISCDIADNSSLLRDRDAVIFFSKGRGTAVHKLAGILSGRLQRRTYPDTPKIRVVHLAGGEVPPAGSLAFQPEAISESLGQVVSEAGLTQVRISESVKAPHITYYFNGGTPTRFKREERVIIDSGDLLEFERAPKMAAQAVTRSAVRCINSKRFDLVVLNYANTDLVGHTGDLKAAIQAVETVEACLSLVLAAINRVGGMALVTSDHGNCETMLCDSGRPHRAHTSNDVPFNLVSFERTIGLGKRRGALQDVAPTALRLLGLEKPPAMTGTSLL